MRLVLDFFPSGFIQRLFGSLCPGGLFSAKLLFFLRVYSSLLPVPDGVSAPAIHSTSNNLSTMSSTFYIPPQGLLFRIIGYATQNAIFCRNTVIEPNVGDYSTAYGEFADQWFTLLHDSENHPGLYAIKSQVTGNVLFSRSHVDPRVGQAGGDGKYADKWVR